jgi:CBS domain containing-hemolysin-like protein
MNRHDSRRETSSSLATPGRATKIDTALGLLSIVALIALNGFYVAGEFALVAVDRSRIERKADEGSRSARRVLAGLKTLSFQLSGAQLGITITSLLVGFILEPTIGRAIRPLLEDAGLPERTALGLSVALALAVASASQMVFGELVPKNIAIARPEGVAKKVTGPLRFSNLLFRPLIVFLNESANFTVRLLGIEPRDELTTTRSLEELEVLIQSSREGGALEEEEYSLLTRSISFGEKTAEDALVPRTSVVTIPRSATLADLAELALKTGHSRFPVIGEDVDDIVGFAHVKDIFKYPPKDRDDVPVTKIVQDALVAPESKDLKSLLLEMRRGRGQLAIVIDEYGGVAGIVTLEDLIEEIVGDIEDEHDPTYVTPELVPNDRGVHVLSGLLRRNDVLEQTGLEMPEGDFETLAGFMLDLFDRVPAQGEHVSYGPWELKVVEMDRNRIAKVLVVQTEEPTPPGEGDTQP